MRVYHSISAPFLWTEEFGRPPWISLTCSYVHQKKWPFLHFPIKQTSIKYKSLVSIIQYWKYHQSHRDPQSAIDATPINQLISSCWFNLHSVTCARARLRMLLFNYVWLNGPSVHGVVVIQLPVDWLTVIGQHFVLQSLREESEMELKQKKKNTQIESNQVYFYKYN